MFRGGRVRDTAANRERDMRDCEDVDSRAAAEIVNGCNRCGRYEELLPGCPYFCPIIAERARRAEEKENDDRSRDPRTAKQAAADA